MYFLEKNIVKTHETEYKCQNLQKTIPQSNKNKYIQNTSEYTESNPFPQRCGYTNLRSIFPATFRK